MSTGAIWLATGLLVALHCAVTWRRYVAARRDAAEARTASVRRARAKRRFRRSKRGERGARPFPPPVVPRVYAVPSAAPPEGIPPRSFKSYEPPPMPAHFDLTATTGTDARDITAAELGFGDLASDPAPSGAADDFTGNGGAFGGSGASGET